MASIQQVTVGTSSPSPSPPNSVQSLTDFLPTGGFGRFFPGGLDSRYIAQLQMIAAVASGQARWVSRYYGTESVGSTGGMPFGIETTVEFIDPTVINPTAPQAAMTTSPNLDVSFDAWGSPIPLLMGHWRQAGHITFAQGLEVGTSAAAVSFIDIEVSFGYPLDSLEWQWIEVVAIWANGNKIYGGDDDLEGLSFTFYEGKEDSPVAPEVLADKGAARATGMRGMRRIVFKGFPIGVFGNSLPTFGAEFSMTKDAPAPLIKVADVLKKIHARGGVTLTTESNFDDDAVGVGFMSDVAPVALAKDWSPTYNFYIRDGNGASVSRRAVNDDLVIDGDPLDVDDMIVESPEESPITFESSEPTEISRLISIQYPDVDLAFTNGQQQAPRPNFPIRQVLSDRRGTIQLPLALDAVTALKLGYGQLYREWTERNKFKFKSSDIRIEVGDVKHITGHELGDFIVHVTKSNLRFDSAVVNELEAVLLLKKTGVDVNADSGDYITNTIIKALDYPDIIYHDTSTVIPDVQWGQIIIADGAICTFGIGRVVDFTLEYGFIFAPASIPTKISHGNFVPSLGPSQPASSSTGQILQDASNVYIVDLAQSGIQRISKSDISDTQYLDLTGSTGILANYGNQFAIDSGYMYWADFGAASVAMKAWRLDLSSFTAAGLTSLALDGDTTTFFQIGAAVVGTDLLLTTFDTASAKARIYKVDLTDPSFATFTSHNTIAEPAAGQGYLGRGVSDGAHAYFLPIEPGGESFGKSTQHWGAKVDPAALGSITWFNIFTDTNVTSLSIGNVFPWTDNVNLYFLANDDHSGAPYDQFLAARKLSDLSVVAGFDLSSVYDDTNFDFFHGASDDTSHYITGANLFDKLGAIIKVEQDLSAAELFYRGNAPAPDNDNFANAAPLTLNTIVSTSNIFATKEAGEPNHAGNAGGASIWYAFTAPATATVTIESTTPTIDILIAVYTGTEVGSLTPVDSNAFSSLSFSATSGTRYMIALDGFDGASGKFTFTIS